MPPEQVIGFTPESVIGFAGIPKKDALANITVEFAHDPYVTAQSTLSHVEWALGYPATALRRSTFNLESINLDAANPNTVSYMLIWHAILTLFCEREDLTTTVVEKLSTHARRSGGKFWGALGMMTEGIRLARTANEIGRAHV